MDTVNVMVVIAAVIFLLMLLFETGILDKLVGMEYFEEKYSFQKPVSINYVRDLFLSLELKEYNKKLSFYIDMNRYYSIGHEGFNDWSSWLPLERMPNKSFDDYDIRYKNAWTIKIFGPYLNCIVYHNDSCLLYEGDEYSEIRLVGLGIAKYSWNARKIKNEKKFLEDIVSALKEIDQKNVE